MKKILTFFMNEPDKIVYDLIAENDLDYLDEQSFEKLVKALQAKVEQVSPSETIDALFQNTRKITSWKGRLKALLVFHRLTHTLGTDFVTSFSKQKLPNYAEHKKKYKGNNKALVHVALAQNYQNYLVKLTYNYEDFKLIFNHSIDMYQHLLQQNLTLLHLLSKVQNLLSVLLKFDLFFDVCLLQFPSESIVKQAAYFILTDCYHYYTFVTNNINIMIEDIFNLPSDEAIFLYEIYSENIQATKQLKAFMDFRNVLQDFEIKEPAYYKFDAELNKKVELYINDLKLRVKNARIRKLNRHLSLGGETEITTVKPLERADSSIKVRKNNLFLENFAEEEHKEIQLDIGSEKNIRELSKNIFKIETSSFQLTSGSSSRMVFLPPKRKSLEERTPESQILQKKISSIIMPSTISVRQKSGVGQKPENIEESTHEGNFISLSNFKKGGEGTRLGQIRYDNIVSLKQQPVGIDNDGNKYIAAHRTNMHRTPSESFSDSFINPRGNF